MLHYLNIKPFESKIRHEKEVITSTLIHPKLLSYFFPFCFIFLPARILFVLVSRLHLLQTSPVVETLQSNHRAKPACIVGDVV